MTPHWPQAAGSFTPRRSSRWAPPGRCSRWWGRSGSEPHAGSLKGAKGDSKRARLHCTFVLRAAETYVTLDPRFSAALLETWLLESTALEMRYGRNRIRVRIPPRLP